MNNPSRRLLSISIPTLNGGKYLEETIEAAAFEASAFEDVELLVLDNASKDSTQEICSRLASQINQLRYVRNSETIPFDLNVNKVVAQSNSEYVWILADDDVLNAGAISAVRSALLKWQPEVALVNFQMVDAELRSMSTSRRSEPVRDASNVWTDAGEALLGAGFEIFGLLSAIIVKRETWVAEALKQPIAEKDGFEFLYLVPRLMMLGTTVYLADEFVKFRQYPKRWQVRNDNSQELEIFFVFIPRILKRLLDSGFDKVVIKQVWRHHLANLTFQIGVARKLGFAWNPSLFRDMLTANWSRATFWVQAPFIFMPTWALLPFIKIYENELLADFLRSILKVPGKNAKSPKEIT